MKKADLASIQVKIPVTLNRKAFVAAFGNIEAKTETFKIRLEFADRLRKTAGQPIHADNGEAVKIEGACNKGLHKEPRIWALALRKLLHREDGLIKFCCQFKAL